MIASAMTARPALGRSFAAPKTARRVAVRMQPDVNPRANTKDSSKSSSKDSTATKVGQTPNDFDAEKAMKDAQAKWESVEDKPTLVVYGIGAVTIVWLSSSLVGAINGIPLLPKLMELVGLAYSTWFVYRYLLFKESREELITDVDELKKKISGDKA